MRVYAIVAAVWILGILGACSDDDSKSSAWDVGNNGTVDADTSTVRDSDGNDTAVDTTVADTGIRDTVEDTVVEDTNTDPPEDTGDVTDGQRDGDDGDDDPTYVDISTADNHACAVRSSGEVLCWGASEHGEATVPTANTLYRSVSTSPTFTCALHQSTGKVDCWGMGSDSNNDEGAEDFDQANPPNQDFTQITTGHRFACGILQSTSKVECWGLGVDPTPGDSSYYDGQSAPPDLEFSEIDAGDRHACGVTTGGLARCWGWNEYGQTDPVGAGIAYANISAGEGFSCGTLTDNTPLCWGLGSDPDTQEDINEGTPDDYDQAVPPSGEFARVSSGYHHSCGIQPGGRVICWGEDDYATRTPAALFDQVAAGDHFTCGIRLDGSLDCWGWATGGRLDHPENTRFLADAAGPAVEIVDDCQNYVIGETVVTNGFSFDPTVADIGSGSVVKWNNTSQALADVQTITSGHPGDPDAGSLFDVEVEVGDSICLLFAAAGDYGYFSRHHTEMTGTVIRR